MDRIRPRLGNDNYPLVDYAKFFFCICIVALHTNVLNAILPETASYFISQVLFRLAVPYFFVATGFFLGKKWTEKDDQSRRTALMSFCIRLARPLVVFEAVNVLIPFVQVLNETKEVILAFLLQESKHALFYPDGALWYVQACIVAALVLYLLQKVPFPICVILGGGGFLFALLSNTYFFVIEGTPAAEFINGYMSICISARNGLFVGFPFMLIGVCLSNRDEDSVNRRTFWFCLPALLILLAEAAYTRDKSYLDDHSMYLSLLMVAPILFLWTISYCNVGRDGMSLHFRHLSAGIYFVHRAVIQVLSLVLNRVGMQSNELLLFFLTVGLSCLICEIAYHSGNKRIAELFQ